MTMTSLGAITHGNLAPDELGELIALCERTGYSTLWHADERFFRDPWASLAYAATLSTNLRLGVAVTDPYVRHPALTATALATIDEISNGRVTLGLGSGVSGFAQMGIDRPQPVAALRETVELIRRLLAGERVTMDGDVVQFHDGAINLGARNDIEMVIATNGPQTLRLAGEISDGVIVQGLASNPMIDNVRALLAEGAARVGREPASVRLIARVDVCIADDGRAARDQMRPGVVRHLRTHYPRFNSQRLAGIEISPELAEAVSQTSYSLDETGTGEVEQMLPDELIDAQCIAGTVEDTAAQVGKLLDAGLDEIIVRPVPLAGEDPSEILRRFATETMPLARAKSSTGASLDGGVPS